MGDLGNLCIRIICINKDIFSLQLLTPNGVHKYKKGDDQGVFIDRMPEVLYFFLV